MKTTWILTAILALAFSAKLTAQNAKPTKGVGSLITFTDKKGVEIRDATVKYVTFEEITWMARNSDGKPFGGRVKFSELPAGLASEFGYDADKVAKINATNAKAAAERNRLAAERSAGMWRANQSASTKMTIIGRVSQVIEDGIMIIGEPQPPQRTSVLVTLTGRFQTPYTVVRTGPPTVDGSPLFVGRGLLTDAEKSGLIDGQPIKSVIYPNGTYTYKSVGAGTATIQKFTLDPTKVTKPATPEQFQMLKETYQFNTPTQTSQ